MALEWLRNMFSGLPRNGQELKGKSVLVIDDGEVERKIYTQALTSAGAKVQATADGRTGLTAARQNLFDLIILDYMLPDINGIEICRELKIDPKTRQIPILFLTGSLQAEGVISCYDAGADCYLSKPISAVTLIEQVRMTLLQESR